MQDLRHWAGGDWFLLPQAATGLPGMIVGASGSGKTGTELRMAYGAAGSYKWQVVFVDGKGDYATAARFIAAMMRAGVPAARIKMFPAAAFGGWGGDGHALLNRLLEVTDSPSPTICRLRRWFSRWPCAPRSARLYRARTSCGG